MLKIRLVHSAALAAIIGLGACGDDREEPQTAEPTITVEQDTTSEDTPQRSRLDTYLDSAQNAGAVVMDTTRQPR